MTTPPAPSPAWWRCPRCKGLLERHGDGLRCVGCGSGYGELDGIPDLRIAPARADEFARDNDNARALVALNLPLDELVRAVFERRGWDAQWVQWRATQVIKAPDRLADDMAGWLGPVVDAGVFLDLGCGSGALLAAASRHAQAAGRASRGVGIDASMTWLVVAKRVIAAHGGVPVLAAALDEALPLADAVLDGVISLDVIEHVPDAELHLREIHRVTAPGGVLALSTPNRLSLAAEPHVNVWGVGWLPQRWQARYVRWRSGKPYEGTRLLTSFGLARGLRRLGDVRFEILIPAVPRAHIGDFPPLKAALATLYNRLCGQRLLRAPFLLVAPFFRVRGRKGAARADSVAL